MTRKSPRRVLLASSWGNQVFALALAQCARDFGWHLDLQTYLTGELPDRWEGEGIIALLEIGTPIAAARACRGSFFHDHTLSVLQRRRDSGYSVST